MTDQNAFDRFVADRFADVQRSTPPAHSLDTILAEARRMRPLPRWLAIIKEPPMRISSRVAVGSPIVRVTAIAILVLLLSAMTAGGMAVGATLLASPQPSGPALLVVALDGSGDFSTISDAVGAARDGDTISVRPGTYIESLMITDDITLEGDGPAGSVIVQYAPDGPTLVSTPRGTVTYGIALDGSDAHLANLVVTGPMLGTAIWVNGGAPVLEGVSVALTDTLGIGDQYPMTFELIGGTTLTLRDAVSTGGMLEIRGGAAPTIERLSHEAGGFVTGSKTRPYITDSRFGFALDISGGAEPIIEDSDLLGVKIAAGAPVIRGNRFANPAFVPGAGGERASEEITAVEIVGGAPEVLDNRIGDHEVGISIDAGSTPTIRGNRIESNTTGVEVSGVRTAPVMAGNTFCDNGTDLVVPNGSTVTLEGNTICEAVASGAP